MESVIKRASTGQAAKDEQETSYEGSLIADLGTGKRCKRISSARVGLESTIARGFFVHGCMNNICLYIYVYTHTHIYTRIAIISFVIRFYSILGRPGASGYTESISPPRTLKSTSFASIYLYQHLPVSPLPSRFRNSRTYLPLPPVAVARQRSITNAQHQVSIFGYQSAPLFFPLPPPNLF